MKPSLSAVPALGGYELTARLGEGSFGAVYAAVDPTTGQRVALKELVRATPDALARFKHEFRSLAEVHHPNLVELKELLEINGRWFIVMELVEGADLTHWMGRAKVQPANDTGAARSDERLRGALLGVAEGLAALHGYGIVHRDLKPSNIQVSDAGRAVLLDFGLATARDAASQSTQAGGVGSAAYMAPEQAAGKKVGPAADWYAFGSCLYEVLTGRAPFAGNNVLQIMLQKQTQRPVPPSVSVRGVPDDLEALCMALLSPDPEERPQAAEILERLSRGDRMRVPPSLAPSMAPEGVFAGREGEIEQLRDALDRTDRGELSIMLVEGESGVGKSSLVAEFVRRQRALHPSTWVLRGRCYQNEHVPYKAFDGCIDVLAKVLKRLPQAECAALLPARAGLLTQLFPVLRGVPALAKASVKDASAEPTARRLEAFAAFGALLSKLAETRPLVLVIDDLQWADAESFRLLRALVEGERPPLLLLGTVRPRHELEREVAESLDKVRAWPQTSAIALRGLSRADAQTLATQLLGMAAPEPWLRTIASESRGHPLFLAELVHYAATHDAREGGPLTLDAALAARIRALPHHARKLLELVALAGKPCSVRVLSRALSDDDLDAATKVLLAQRLVRRREVHELTCVHDKVRAVAEGSIATEVRPQLHRWLAEALCESVDGDPGEEALHWQGAGETLRATRAYERAATEALANLAFASAERLYGCALALIEDRGGVRARDLTVQRGHALSAAGRSAEAALLYQEAAAHSEGEARIRLRVFAAQQLIQSAQVAEGMRAAKQVLLELGIPVPASAAGAFARISWDRTCLALRGLDAKTSNGQGVSGAQNLALDSLHALGPAVGWVEIWTGAALNTCHLRQALSAGEPAHVARALGQEANFRVMQNPERRDVYVPLLERARELAAAQGLPELVAFQLFQEATAAQWAGDIAGALALNERAHELVQAECPGEAWLLTNIRTNLGSLWWTQGAYAQGARETQAWLRDARERGDRFALTSITGLGLGAAYELMQNGPDAAQARLVEAMAPWPAQPFGLAHVGELLAAVQVQSYRGGSATKEWLLSHASLHRGAFMLKTPLLRGFLASSHASAALSAMEHATAEQRAALLREAQVQLELLEHSRLPLARSSALALEAQLAALSGEHARAIERASAAVAVCERLGLDAGPMRYLEGTFEGGEGGRRKCESVLTFYRDQGWKDPWRAIAMFAPVLRLLDGQAQRAAPPDSALLGGRYKLLDAADSVVDGEIARARDMRTGRAVELKVLSRVTPEALARFKQEFRVMQGLYHPSLVRLEALFEHDGRWMIARKPVEGVNLLTWVRGAGPCDEARLRALMQELVRAVALLHEAGFAHRDLNPESVRVSAEGRVVLLEFGLIASFDDIEDIAGIGAVHYMAPELLDGGEVHGAADVYALGACLYQALTGILPYDARTNAGLIKAKQLGRPVPPAIYEPNVAADLDALCMRMLERDPARRPSLQAVLSALQLGELVLPATSSLRSSIIPSLHAPAMRNVEDAFAGREVELRKLEHSFAQTLKGLPALMLVEGESGLGKTALCGEVLKRIEQAHPNALILRSRCFENEALAYKAFDAALDELARQLRRLPVEACSALLPSKVGLLPQLFPVLGSVRAIATASLKGVAAEPSARRLQAFEALRALWSRLCWERPVVLAIDDLQWADLESFRLLRALFEGEEPPALFVLATVRPREEHDADTAAQLELVRSWTHAESVTLTGLARPEAEQMAAFLLGPSVPAHWLDVVVRESRGHPLFLRELALYVRHGTDGAQTAGLTLEDALRARLNGLEPAARGLLELLALAGRPCATRVLERALGESERVRSDALSSLLSQKLVRVRQSGELVCYHDRIRRAAVQAIEPEHLSRLAGRLAAALESEQEGDAADRARLWEFAGERQAAIAAYAQAGGEALEQLAFARAEQVYTRALTLAGDAREPAIEELRVKRAHALARGGRSEAAARAYAEVAGRAEGEARVRLRVLVAQQLIQSAQVVEGMAAARSLLEELGVPLSQSTAGAIARLSWERMCLAAGGLEVKTREPRDVLPEERLLLEAVEALTTAVGWVEVLPSAALNTRYLRRALAVGEPAHVTRALCLEAQMRAMRQPERREQYAPLFARARAMAQAVGDPALKAYQGFVEATAAIFANDLREARPLLEQAHETLVMECPGQPWLLTNVRMNLGAVWAQLGEHRLLHDSSSLWMNEAHERDDRFACAALSGLGLAFLRHLMHDDPDGAREETALVMAPWPAEPFGLAHVGEAISVQLTEHYRGGEGSLAWWREHRARYEGAFLLKGSRTLRLSVMGFQAAGFVCAMQSAPAAQRGALREQGMALARSLKREGTVHADGTHALFVTQLAAADGETDKALLLAQPYKAWCVAQSSTAALQSCAYLEGLLRGGDDGREQRQTALTFFREQGWKKPWHAVTMHVPVIRLLEAPQDLPEPRAAP